MKFLNKKAISPLIATVLLIGFTVAVAVVVMNFGTDITSSVMGTTTNRAQLNKECMEGITLKVDNIICTDNGANTNIAFSLINNGDKEIYKLQYTVTGDGGQNKFYVYEEYAGSSSGNIILGSNGGKSVNLNNVAMNRLIVRHIEIKPFILTPENKEYACSNTLKIDNPCSTTIQ